MQRLARAVLGIGLLGVLVAPLLAGGDAKDDAIKSDRKKYEGTWQVMSLEVDGNISSEEDAKKFTVTNEADGRWTLEKEGEVVARGTSEIDPTKVPRTIDFVVIDNDGSTKKALGIYELGDDTRKVCLVEEGRPRPNDFSASAGTERIYAVLKRVKK